MGNNRNYNVGSKRQNRENKCPGGDDRSHQGGWRAHKVRDVQDEHNPYISNYVLNLQSIHHPYGAVVYVEVVSL